tara:strand:- start:471 stop:953 length:483 start_codon:yes stop_codon:yes gene_type:complete
MSKNLEKRVQELEDILAIQNLKHTYLNACDTKDVQAMISTFVISDCRIDYGPVGSFSNRDDLAAVFQEVACHEYMLESHHAHNPIINILDSTHATGHWSLTYNLINKDNSSITTLQGEYHDIYQKIDNHWLIKETTFLGRSTLNLEIDKELLKVIFAGRP